MKYTIVLMEGIKPRYCVGIFDSHDEAERWAINDGLTKDMFRVLKLYP